MSNDKKQEQPKPTAPKVDKAALDASIKSHEQAKSTNQTVKK
jgi:hypothetical protein